MNTRSVVLSSAWLAAVRVNAIAIQRQLIRRTFISTAFPENIKQVTVNEMDIDKRNSDLLEIRDLIKAVGGHGDEEMALLNQLTILPSETAINHEAVSGEQTCKLCSTIIYRPLKDDKKL